MYIKLVSNNFRKDSSLLQKTTLAYALKFNPLNIIRILLGCGILKSKKTIFIDSAINLEICQGSFPCHIWTLAFQKYDGN